ncbi:hypothetical protein N7523_007141 [Penicillium sp. IBT 18751x]|nr:hypothetical protein N7523_007141 [Penicillium sp. IBT 18751x]
MQLTAVLTLSTSLLAGHVWALHADPLNPVGIHNPNLFTNKHAPANHGPAAHAPAANPEIPAYMAPLVKSMASEMAMSMMPKPSSTQVQASMSHAPVAWSNAPLAPHSNLPIYPDVPMYSQGSMYASLSMSASAMSTPYAMPSQAPYSNMYNLPMSSMLTKASSSPTSSMAMVFPTASQALSHFNQPQRPAFHPAQAQAPGQGGIAPVAPLAPGSNVAPVQLNSNYGSDEGNAFCLGQCFSSEEEAQCEKPATKPVYRSAMGCYTCCFTAGDF